MKKRKTVKSIEDYFMFDYIDINIDGDSAIFRLNNYCGQILLEGKIDFVIAAEDIKYVDGKLLAVKKHGQWGVVHRNELTKWIIKPRYECITYLYDTYFLVGKQHKKGIINSNNEVIVPFIYDLIFTIDIDANKFIARMNGKDGIIDINGEVIVPFIYDRLDETDTDSNKFIAEMNGKNGIIDINGEVIVPFIYDEIYQSYISENIFMPIINGKYGIIDTNGNPFKIDKKELTDMIKLCEAKKESIYGNKSNCIKDTIINIFDGEEL